MPLILISSFLVVLAVTMMVVNRPVLTYNSARGYKRFQRKAVRYQLGLLLLTIAIAMFVIYVAVN
jgi:hypothetical protein